MIHNINIKTIMYVIIINEIVILFVYPGLFSSLAIAENWNLENEQTLQKVVFFGLKANLGWNFRVGPFPKVACVSLMGGPMIRACTVFNAKESVVFRKSAVL